MGRVLTDDQLAGIAWADPCERTVDLAQRIGAPPEVAASARRRMQAAGGWWCQLRLTRCAICNGPLLGRTKARPRQLHPSCERGRQSQLRTEAKQRDQALTRECAHQPDRPWTPEEDARVLAPRHGADRELALELGRTLLAVHSRRVSLRKRERTGSRPPTTRRAPNAGKRVRDRPLRPVPVSLPPAGLITLAEAATRTGVRIDTIRKWIRRDRPPTVQLGRDRFLHPDDLAAMQAVTQADGVIPAWREDRQRAGTRLREVREAAGLTQLELAAASGLTHEAISNIETGKRAPLVTTVRALARALRVEPERFVAYDPVGLSLLTTAEAAKRLDVPVGRVQVWLKEGALPGTKVSGEWRVPAVAVAELNRSGRLRGRSRRLDPRYRG